MPEENWRYDDYRLQHPETDSPEREPPDWNEEFSKRRGQYSTSGVPLVRYTVSFLC